MTAVPDHRWISTRASLIQRLKNLDDRDSWQDFFNTYWKLIYSVALKSGLSEHESEDVVQETVLSVAKTIEKYRYDPAVTFKGWLKHLTNCRIADQFRKRRKELLYDDLPATKSGHHSSVDEIADPADPVVDAVWDEEWQRNVTEAALQKLAAQISVKQYQVFYLHVIRGRPVREVAAGLKASAAYVHLVKHRVGRLFRKIVARVEKNQG